MSLPAQRNRFLADSVSTASPARLLTMLYDRLVLDLARAEEADRAGERQKAHENLLHAQSIVSELLSSLDVDAWDGAPRLAGIYTFLLGELVRANVSSDADRTAQCRELVEPLRDAWHEASALSAAPAAAATA